MITGDSTKINLSTSSFEHMITDGNLYVDKTRFIENFLNQASEVQLIARQRRLGKSLNMDMLNCFLTDKTDYRHLFKGLYIETSPVWESVNSAPVFYFDFKLLKEGDYIQCVHDWICDYINAYCEGLTLSRAAQRFLIHSDSKDPRGLLYLTESVYRATGKRSYILIDEYDNLLMDSYQTDKYEEIKKFKTDLFSSGLKGNKHLKKALLTGVMRISYESLLSGLNNLDTFDVFNDNVYVDDYGITEAEAAELSGITSLDLNELKAWYNGVKINGKAIYNMYSVMSCISRKVFDCYWGKSGVMDIISSLLNDERKLSIARLLNGERVEAIVRTRISFKQLSGHSGDGAFYSFLVQSGYLTLDELLPGKESSMLTIPNKELLTVWKDFILDNLYFGTIQIKTMFDNTDDLNVFSSDLEYFLSDRLSYHDLAVSKGEHHKKLREQIYHTFVLGILSAYYEVGYKRPVSNRESGDGRYDILVEKPDKSFVFEFKVCDKEDDLDKEANEALKQIELRRYGIDIDRNKPLIKIGVAFYGKRCRVRCG